MKEENITRAIQIGRELDYVRNRKKFIEDFKCGKMSRVSIEAGGSLVSTLANSDVNEDYHFAIRKFLDDIYDLVLREEKELLEELESL